MQWLDRLFAEHAPWLTPVAAIMAFCVSVGLSAGLWRFAWRLLRQDVDDAKAEIKLLWAEVHTLAEGHTSQASDLRVLGRDVRETKGLVKTLLSGVLALGAGSFETWRRGYLAQVREDERRAEDQS